MRAARFAPRGRANAFPTTSPGASIALPIALVTPEVPTGSYRVEISALQEGVAWLPDPAVFTVEVRR